MAITYPGVFRDINGNDLLPITSADQVLVGDGSSDRTLDDVLKDIESGNIAKDYILEEIERVAGTYKSSVLNTNLYRITYFDVSFPNLKNDTWVDLKNVSSLNIKELIRCYGVIYDALGKQISVESHGALYFAYNPSTKYIRIMSMDDSFSFIKGHLVIEYIKG